MLGRLKFEIDPLIEEVLGKIPEEMFTSSDTTFADLQMGGGQFMAAIIDKLKSYGHSDENINQRVFGFAEKRLYLYYVLGKELLGMYKLYENDIDMKFDVIIGNPPYQKKVGPKKTQAIWPEFVEKAFELCKEGGYVSLIHPTGWRSPDGVFKPIQKLLKDKHIIYIHTHTKHQGVEVFGASTEFDVCCVKNVKNQNGEKTLLLTPDKEEYEVDLTNVEYIPNGKIDVFDKVIAKEGEEKVNLLHSYSDYETRKSWMSKEKTDDNIHPCVYTVLMGGTINKYYSTTKENGHFGIPKIIWSNGTTSIINDMTGEYGLTQFSYAIVDDVSVLPKIKKAMETPEFIELMRYADGNDHKYVYKVIRLFRKDFWKEFIDEDDL